MSWVAYQSLLAATRFAGRSSLYPHEVADVLRIDTQQVIDLCDEEVIRAVRINGANNKSARSNYRIPVCEYDRYITAGGTPKAVAGKSNGANGHAKNGHARTSKLKHSR